MSTRKNTSKRDWGKIVNEGAGDSLNPPTHPEHNQSVHSVYGDTFIMSLSHAAESKWLNDETRFQASNILTKWKEPELESPSVQDWVFQVMGYFRGCYQGKDKNGAGSWNAGNLLISKELDAIQNQDIHAGVNLIRKYYPNFKLEQRHVDAAYWGSKKAA